MTKIEHDMEHARSRNPRTVWWPTTDRCFDRVLSAALPRLILTSGLARLPGLPKSAARTLVACVMLFCGIGLAAAGGQSAPIDRPRPTSDAAVQFSKVQAGAAGGMVLGVDVYGLEVGDRIRISVYGRDDLTKEYRINDRGQLRIPVLGTFDAKSLNSAQLEDKIRDTIERSTQRPAYVSVEIVERRPVFVTGVVVNSGAYRFSPGMAVIHATALAGGISAIALAASLPIVALRESSQIRIGREEMKHLIARRARLLTDRQGNKNIAIPPQLVELAGAQRAAELIKEEQEVLNRERLALARQEAALKSAVEHGKIEVAAIEEEQLKVAEQRRLRAVMVAGIEKLNKKRLTTSQRLTDALMLLASVDRDAQNIIALKARGQQTLKTAERNLAVLPLERKIQIDKDRQLVDEQLSKLRTTIEGAHKIISRITGLPSGFLLQEIEPQFRFEILRKGADGEFGSILASETTLLRPGDVLRVTVASGLMGDRIDRKASHSSRRVN